MPNSKNVEKKKGRKFKCRKYKYRTKKISKCKNVEMYEQKENKKRIETLYQRHNDSLINSFQLLTGLSYLVGNKIWL